MAVAADEVCGKLEDIESSENSNLSQELQVLKEIYITELSINSDASGHCTSIDVQLHPATGENVSQKWVCLTLQLIPPPDYPHSIPEICIRGPRGLADEHVASMKKRLYQIAEERKGEPMMYELIESAKESLTQLNVPYGQCMICLDDFSGSYKEFTKTDCYHYFHCGCLSLYVDHCKTELEAPTPSNAFTNTEVNKQVVCPVCREPLPSDLDLSACKPGSGAEMLEERYTPSEEMQELQKTMADLFEKQKQKGGIIDLDEERNKYLLPKDFVYVGPVEESSQDTPLAESVQTVKENDQTSKNPRHQRQRDYGGRGGNKGKGEHERGGRGARKNRKEYDFERSEFSREREEYGDERGEYGRKRGGYGRERDYAKERSTYARERGYRRPRQEEKQGTWRNEEGSRSNRSNKFYDQKQPGDIGSTASEAQHESAGNENGSTEKMERKVETEQRIETENSEHGDTVTQEKEVEGGSAKLDQVQKVEEVESQRTMKNSRQNDSTFHGKEAPSKKSGDFLRRERRQEHDRYDRRVEEEFPRRSWQKSQHHGERHQDFHSKGSDDRERSKYSEHGDTVTQEKQVEGGSAKLDEGGSAKLDQVRQVEDVESQRTMKNPRQNDSTFHGKEAPSKKSGNFLRRDRRQEHDRYDRRVEEEFPRRSWQKSQHHGERHQDFHSKGSDNREQSKYSSEMLNFSEQSVKEIEMLQKEELANDKKLENAPDIEVISSCQGKSEPISSGSQNSNRKPSERDNRNRWQRHHRRDQDQKQYHEEYSQSNSANKDEMLKDKTSDDGRDGLKDRGSGMASTNPEQPKDLADSPLCETKMLGLNTNDTSIPHVNKTSAKGQSSKHVNHFKPRIHARGKAGNMDDHHERSAGTDETSREHLQRDFHSKPKTVTHQENREYPGKTTIIQRNYKNPQRFEAKSHPNEGRQFNDRQKFRKDAKVETTKDRNDISESRTAQNDRPTCDEPRSSLNATNPKSSHSDKTTEVPVHPGFHIRSISTVDTAM